MGRAKKFEPGQRVRWHSWPDERGWPGVVIRWGRDALGVYVEVKLDVGELQRIHPSQLSKLDEIKEKV